MKNSVRNSVQSQSLVSQSLADVLFFEALSARFGNIDDSELVMNLMNICYTLDKGNGVVHSMLLGKYCQPQHADVRTLWHKSHKVYGEVLAYDPFSDGFHIEYTYQPTDKRYFKTEDDMRNNIDGVSGWERERQGQDKYPFNAVVNTGKPRTERDFTTVSDIENGYGNWSWQAPVSEQEIAAAKAEIIAKF